MVRVEVILSITGLSLGFLCSACLLHFFGENVLTDASFLSFLVGGLMFTICIYITFKKCHQLQYVQVVTLSTALGAVCNVGLSLVQFGPEHCINFGWYMVVVAFFHFSEYLTVALFNPCALSVDSFLINHGFAYTLAFVLSWLEFWIEYGIFVGVGWVSVFNYLGLMMCVSGEILRKTAMITAGVSFNHIIQSERRRSHTLITHGVYSLVRHPSYLGWFMWSVGTQLVLFNPVCVFGYAVTTWVFFKRRVIDEEALLLRFFGDSYVIYMRRVPSGIPGVGAHPALH